MSFKLAVSGVKEDSSNVRFCLMIFEIICFTDIVMNKPKNMTLDIPYLLGNNSISFSCLKRIYDIIGPNPWVHFYHQDKKSLWAVTNFILIFFSLLLEGFCSLHLWDHFSNFLLAHSFKYSHKAYWESKLLQYLTVLVS